MRRCTDRTRTEPEQVTVTFDPEDSTSTYAALRDQICPDNLRAVGLALISYAEQNGH